MCWIGIHNWLAGAVLFLTIYQVKVKFRLLTAPKIFHALTSWDHLLEIAPTSIHSGIRRKFSWGYIWCALFVMSHFDVIFTFPNYRFGEVCWHDMHILLQGPSSVCRQRGLIEHFASVFSSLIHKRRSRTMRPIRIWRDDWDIAACFVSGKLEKHA